MVKVTWLNAMLPSNTFARLDTPITIGTSVIPYNTCRV